MMCVHSFDNHKIVNHTQAVLVGVKEFVKLAIAVWGTFRALPHQLRPLVTSSIACPLLAVLNRQAFVDMVLEQKSWRVRSAHLFRR